MFFEDPSPSYFAPVVYRQFDADGKVVEKKFDIQCRRFKSSEHAALDTEIQSLRGVADPKAYDALLAKVLLAWRVKVKVGDSEELKVVAFAPATLDEMEERFPGFTFACARAFYASLMPAESAHYASKN